MKSRTAISILVASVLAFTSMASFAQQGRGSGPGADRGQQVDRDRNYDRDRMSDRDRSYDRDRTRNRDRVDVPDQKRDRDRIHDSANLSDKDIYGNGLMTPAERNQYRAGLANAGTPEASQQFQAQHEQAMQQRAQQQGQDLVPPGQGPIYGGELMSVQERNEYREQLRLTDSDAERQSLQARHREQMQVRSRALNIKIEEAE